MVGLSLGHDDLIVRGDMDANSFTAFYLKDGVVISADSVNRPQDFMLAKRLVAERAAVSPERLRDDAVPLKSLLQATA
jgi:3-phenylpropionate/trans-cinnamate dioxygenase ferredoxin reductase subunit